MFETMIINAILFEPRAGLFVNFDMDKRMGLEFKAILNIMQLIKKYN